VSGEQTVLPTSAQRSRAGRAFGALLGRHFWITAYLMFVLGLWLPGDYRWLRPSVPFFLGGILFFSCLKIGFSEIRSGLRPRTLGKLAALTPWRLVVMPLLAAGATALIAPQWAGGVLILCASPAAMSSVALTDLYGGNRMFALLQLLATTVLCPLTVPLLLAHVHLDYHTSGMAAPAHGALTHQILYILLVLGTPFTLAQLTRQAAGAVVERHHARWGLFAVLSSCCLIFIAASSNRQAWSQWSLWQLLLPMGLASLVCLLGLGMGLASRRCGLDRGEAIAFGCGEIWINNGLAVAFVSQFYPDNAYMLLPAILMQLPIVAVMTFYGWLVRYRFEAKPTPGAG
jgi:predicted Na+-dependent transporter